MMVKLLQQETVDVEDWEMLLSSVPSGEDKLFWCLGCTSSLCALDATNFDDWFIYCRTVVDSALEACKIDNAAEERKNLLALGLAARTFNFSANPVTEDLKCADTLRSAGEYACSEDLNHLDLICEALDCSPTEILVREPNPEPRVRNRTGFEKPVTGQRKDGE